MLTFNYLIKKRSLSTGVRLKLCLFPLKQVVHGGTFVR